MRESETSLQVRTKGAVEANPAVVAGGFKFPTIATPKNKESGLIGVWKPVIDGKMQASRGIAARKSSSPPIKALCAATSSEKHSSTDIGSSSLGGTASSEFKKDANESDLDTQRVPEMSSKPGASGVALAQPHSQSSGSRKSKKREGSSKDKDSKHLKRLLRNRVSAQQARERKKAFVTDLELNVKTLEERNTELRDKISSIESENRLIRQQILGLGGGRSSSETVG